MEKLELLINHKIEVIWERQAYRSNIQELNDDNFSISIPTKDGEYIPLRAGELAEVIYYEKLNIYQFYSKVIGRKVEGIPLIVLEIPEEYTVVQRRQYYRVPKLDFISFSNYKKVNLGENDKTKPKLDEQSNIMQKAAIIDLSGGGMKIKLEHPVEKGDVIHFFLKTYKEEIEIYGKVVRVEIDEQKFYICGICFLDLTKLEREKIIQYTFEIMRNQRSKGL